MFIASREGDSYQNQYCNLSPHMSRAFSFYQSLSLVKLRRCLTPSGGVTTLQIHEACTGYLGNDFPFLRLLEEWDSKVSELLFGYDWKAGLEVNKQPGFSDH